MTASHNLKQSPSFIILLSLTTPVKPGFTNHFLILSYFMWFLTKTHQSNQPKIEAFWLNFSQSDQISLLGSLCLFLKEMNFRSLEDFWAFYVNQHSKPSTRRWHFAGTLSSILLLIYSVLFNWWFLVFVPIFGYGLAWYSHFFVEGNVPATFGHPFWSLLCDFRMFGLMLTGKMDREIKRLGKRPILQGF